MDDLNNELENAMFSSATPVNKLGHSIAGGITNYGIEVFDMPRRHLQNVIANLVLRDCFSISLTLTD